MADPIEPASLARTYGFPMTPPNGAAAPPMAPRPAVDPHLMAGAFLRNLAARGATAPPAQEPHIPGVNGALPPGAATAPTPFAERLRSIILGVQPKGSSVSGDRG